jgi:16S rRNA (adenine1518-N6/adenine1519-N6)-dimethyltransferase
MGAMSLLEKTKFLLRQYGIFPKKRLGQNIMVDPSIFKSMAVYASLNQSDVVLDIGAGLGFLTRFLAEKCKRVLAVELDSRLVKVLREQLKDLPNVEIIEGNVLKVQVRQFNKVVSIPPYNISSSLLPWLFNKNFDCATLIFQKEFAKRLVASIGSEDYGWLTVVTYYYFEVELFDDVPKWMFYPQPEVDSIIIRLKPRSSPPFTLKNETFFQQLVQKLFTQRNRKVRNAVLPFIKSIYGTLESAVKMADSLPFHDRRVRELAPEDFGELTNAIYK